MRRRRSFRRGRIRRMRRKIVENGRILPSQGRGLLAIIPAAIKGGNLIKKICHVAEALEPRTLLAAVLVKDIDTTSLSSNPMGLFMFGAKGYFAANDGVHGIELWSTDGTAAGTQLVKDIYPGSRGSIPSFLGEFNGYMFISADAGSGGWIWRSDGTEAGRSLFRSVNASSQLIPYKSAAYFTVGNALWKTDGTVGGTVVVDSSGFHSYLTRAGDYLFYTNSNTAAGFELWRSDGTAAGSMMVKDINPGTSNGLPEYLREFNGLLYFRAASALGTELWKSDGTLDGTVMVRDISAGSASTFIDNPTVLGSLMIFRANQHLWRSDGSEGGTFELTSFNVLSDSTAQGPSFKTANGLGFFTGTSGGQYGLWRSDGTVDGTFMVHLVPSGYVVDQFSGLSDGLYFRISNNGVQEFWKSDGTV